MKVSQVNGSFAINTFKCFVVRCISVNICSFFISNTSPVLAQSGETIDTPDSVRLLLQAHRYKEVINVTSTKITKVSNLKTKVQVSPGDWRQDLPGHALVFRELSAEQLRAIYLADMYCIKAMALNGQGKLQEAESNFRKATTLNPYQIQAYNQLGTVLVKLGQLDKALKIYSQSIACNSRQGGAYRNRSEVYRRTKQFALEQKDIETYHYWRRLNFKEDIKPLFLAKFEYAYHIISKMPRNAKTLTALGVIHCENKTLQPSEKCFKAAIEVDPRLAEAHSAYGMLLFREKKYEAAVKEFDIAIALDPNFCIPYYNKGQSYAILRKYREAIAAYRKFLGLNPPASNLVRNAYSNRGNCYKQLGQFEGAIQDFSKALALGPVETEKASCLCNRGACFEGMGNREQALKDYDQALAFAPTHKLSFERRGKMMLSMGEYEQAMADLGTSSSAIVDDISKEPPSPTELKKLIDRYSELIRLFPASTESLYNRGLLYLTGGNAKGAAADMQAVVALTKVCNVTSDYAACYCNIALRLSNRTAEADKFSHAYSKLPRHQKAAVEVEYFLVKGSTTVIDTRELTGNMQHRTRMLTLYGLDALARHDRVKAREYLTAVRNGGEPSMDEFALAMAYLKRLGY